MRITKRQLKRIIREEYSRLKRAGLITEMFGRPESDYEKRNKKDMREMSEEELIAFADKQHGILNSLSWYSQEDLNLARDMYYFAREVMTERGIEYIQPESRQSSPSYMGGGDQGAETYDDYDDSGSSQFPYFDDENSEEWFK